MAPTTEEKNSRGSDGPILVWMTGLSGSGKTTLAQAVKARLSALGVTAMILDGDELRQGLCQDVGFDKAGRAEQARRAAEMARLVVTQGAVAIVALISPFSRDRQRAREIVTPFRMLEVFVNAPLTVCEQRDPKGLYKAARSGALRDFAGISSPYEAPLAPDLEVRTDLHTVNECAEIVMERIDSGGLGRAFETPT